ncbi:Collagen alpha-6(VI) chain [Aphelenchoides fujianensis]|nr:Collagen alpha-6(VI) chain [Aphelenchoides fujianensis]
MAAEQIRLSGLDGAATVVLLADNGRVSTDLTGGHDPSDELRSLNATFFAVSGVENSKVAASDGYSAVYSRPQELPAFISTVDEAIGACLDDVQPSGVNSWTPRAFGLRSLAAPVDSPAAGCSGASEIELTILLDTSGSLHSTFERERRLAVELIEHLEPQEAIGRTINVEVISFAEEPTVVARIEFTGGQTRIADGIQLALREWGARSKADVARLLVLISDGHGNDYWDHVRQTAAELKEANVHVFVGSTSTDLDVPRASLASAVISFIAGCLSADRKEAEGAEEPFLPLDSAAHKPQFDPPTAIPTVEGSGWNVHEEEDETTSPTSRPTRIPSSPQIKEWRRAAAAKLFRQTRAESSDEKEADERNSTCATDLVLVIDASQSVEVDFRAQLMLAVEQVKKLPDANFDRDTRVAAVTFHSNATVELPLEHRPKAEVLEKLLAFKHYGGSTSAAKGVTAALDLIEKNRRPNARVVFLLISDGNSQDPWAEVVAVSDRLHSINADVRAATVSKLFFFRELEVYAGDEKRVYTGDRIRDFLDDTTISVLECRTVVSNRSVSITNSLELTATPSPDAVELLKEKLATSTPKEENEATNEQSVASEKPARTFEISAAKDGGIQFAARDQAVESSTLSANQSCNTNKLDLIIILDASTSRENVFEHQRELALGLGLGRDREMVRKALESIKYVGGSTLTSKAIELAIAEMKKGRRPDAKGGDRADERRDANQQKSVQSQDNWEDVVSISQRLEQSGAEVFGVALGDQVDLRELRLYVGNNEARLYRDGKWRTRWKTEDRVLPARWTSSSSSTPLRTLSEENLTEPRLNANRFLVLDVLGSLPLGERVRVAVFSFGDSPHLQFGFDRSQERSELFSAVEAIEATSERPAYARAFQRAAAYLQSKRRPNSNGLLLIVGDGRNTADTAQELKTAREKLGKADLETLLAFTGTADRFFGYEKNAQFAKSLQELAAQRNPSCIDDAPLGTTESTSPSTSTQTTTKKAEEATTTEATSASEQPIFFD